MEGQLLLEGVSITSTTEEHQPGSLCLSLLLTDLLINFPHLLQGPQLLHSKDTQHSANCQQGKEG